MVQESGKNLWVAASDGDLERVQYLIENEGCTPNDKDSNSYTPMHAAASYAHIPLLTYLLTSGGNPNITDDDNETPLFVVESLEVAQFLVGNGADPAWKNSEGATAGEQLEEEAPEVAAYLNGLTGLGGQIDEAAEVGDTSGDISQLALDNFTATQTSALMEEAQRIMEQCAAEGVEPDERLREVVERAVRDGMAFGQATGEGEEGEVASQGDASSKRAREE
ncbi:hypothetical protein B9479_002114 [Cryptococcus floricola]|uniref:Uncharacterized protein n=1 Tax=Cryptococcus floricola TaxID=2591691 RepID=A0A5D3B3K7_9TREE|nr:hypothetical protein B9479_002114 [Cryptococcus floricola]